MPWDAVVWFSFLGDRTRGKPKKEKKKKKKTKKVEEKKKTRNQATGYQQKQGLEKNKLTSKSAIFGLTRLRVGFEKLAA